jgi:hypothetical protein
VGKIWGYFKLSLTSDKVMEKDASKSFEFKLGILAILMLAAALAPMPYGYYGLLRVVTCCFFILKCIRLRQQNTQFPFIASLALTITYNPIIHLPLGRGVWIFVNLITIGIITKLLLKNEKRSP